MVQNPLDKPHFQAVCKSDDQRTSMVIQIGGPVAFLQQSAQYLSELRRRFVETLGLSGEVIS